MSIHNTKIYATFDPIPFRDPESEFFNVLQSPENFALNIQPVTISFQISAGTPYVPSEDTLKFTSNGIFTFRDPITSFEIPKINYVGQDIYFTATLVGLSSFGSLPKKRAFKLAPEVSFLESHPIEGGIGLGAETFEIKTHLNENIIVEETDIFCRIVEGQGDFLDEVTVLPGNLTNFRTTFGSNSSENGGGYLRGAINSSVSATNARIFVRYETDTVTITGLSPFFDIYPNQGLFDIRKCGEDNDQTLNYKNLIYQEILNNKPAFFDNFLGQIVGNSKSNPNSLGILAHEKIENFVSNIGDPDYANVNSLKSLISELDMTYERYNQQFPPSMARLIDIISVGLSNQKGMKNQFQKNFDDRGFTSKTVYGKNKGNKISVENGILQTGDNSEDIIAYEKFSNKYTLLNTNVISASNVPYLSASTSPGVSAYPLSGYNTTWGWGLVVPKTSLGLGIRDFYEFYKFVPGIEGGYIQKFIDFTNEKNTYLQPVTSIPWTGRYETTNRPGGPPWTFKKQEGDGIILSNTGQDTLFDFKEKDFTVEIDTDLTYRGDSVGGQYLVGKWPTGPGTDSEAVGDTWLLINYPNALTVQYSSDGRTSDESAKVRVLSANVPQEPTIVKIEKIGTKTNIYFDDIKVDDNLVLNNNAAPATLPSTDFPIQVGGDIYDKQFIAGVPYALNGTVDSLRISLGTGLTAKEIFKADSNTTTATPLTSIQQFREKYGIAENVISQNLYSNLGLLSGA